MPEERSKEDLNQEIALKRIHQVMKKEGWDILPSQRMLMERGYSSLESTIRLNGGYTQIRKILGETATRTKSPSIEQIEKDLGESFKSYLQREYIEKHTNVSRLAQNLNIPYSFLYKQLKNYGIKRRNLSETLLPQGFVKPSKSQLEQIYLVEHMSQNDIAEAYEVDSGVVRRWLDKHNITKRTAPESRLKKEAIKPSREELYEQYVTEKIGSTKLAKKHHVCKNTILNWLEEYGIERRSGSDAVLPKGVVRPTKDEMKQMYHIDNMTQKKISERVGVSLGAVRKWIIGFGLEKDNAHEREQVENLLEKYVNK